jgi:hypothetical protein
MSFDYIRRTYGVQAARGARVAYTDGDGTVWNGRITSADGQYIRVLVDDRVPGYRRRLRLHPTWNVQYLPPAAPDGVPSTLDRINPKE